MERKIILEDDSLFLEDYQLKMLEINRPHSFLPVKGRGINGKSKYVYLINTKQNLLAAYKTSHVSGIELEQLLLSIKTCIEEAERYLLEVDRIMLDPEHIYVDRGKYYFCYYPPKEGTLHGDFQELAEFVVKNADYSDDACVRMAFSLHKEALKESGDIFAAIDTCIAEGREKDRKMKDRKNYEHREMADRVAETSVYGENPKGYGNLGRAAFDKDSFDESDSAFGSMKRLFWKKKRLHWSDMDDLYIKQEDLY